MFAAFTVQHGAWKFYALLPDKDSLTQLENFFKESDIDYVVRQMPKLDHDMIQHIQDNLNVS
jgi:hypothetical protein